MVYSQRTFTSNHASYITYHVSGVRCHMSHVTWSHGRHMVKLVGGGSVINGAYAVYFLSWSGKLNNHPVDLVPGPPNTGRVRGPADKALRPPPATASTPPAPCPPLPVYGQEGGMAVWQYLCMARRAGRRAAVAAPCQARLNSSSSRPLTALETLLATAGKFIRKAAALSSWALSASTSSSSSLTGLSPFLFPVY